MSESEQAIETPSETPVTVETPVAEPTQEQNLADLIQQMVVVGGTLKYDEVPRVTYMTRPAPTPPGKIAVMLRAFRYGYFLVDLDPNCKGCGGDGLDKRKDASTKASEIPYCPACIHTEIQHFGRIWEKRLADKEEQHAQEERSERADAKLEKRLNEARARVAELEKAKADALQGNALDVSSTKDAIESLKADAIRFDETRVEYERRLKDHNKDFDDAAKRAQAEFDEATKAARAILDEKLANVKRERDNFVAQWGKAVDGLNEEVLDNGRELRKAEEALQRYEAGPAKIAKRWDEKIEPAKKTLERLERQYKS